MHQELIYPGYMSKEAQDFLKGHYEEEERDGLGVVGVFIKTHDGKTIMPSKGDVFIKDESGISLGEKKSLSETVMYSKERMRKKAQEYKKLTDLAREAYKNSFKEGTGNSQSTFILGFISGYKSKENE